ncbi:Uncharacterised protein [Escherichia coli]|nr:Uncharacterised protein [Escherichia coli]
MTLKIEASTMLDKASFYINTSINNKSVRFFYCFAFYIDVIFKVSMENIFTAI